MDNIFINLGAIFEHDILLRGKKLSQILHTFIEMKRYH